MLKQELSPPSPRPTHTHQVQGKHLVMNPWILFQRKQVHLNFSHSCVHINPSSKDQINTSAGNSVLEQMGKRLAPPGFERKGEIWHPLVVTTCYTLRL